MSNKSDGVFETSDALWRSARIFISEFFFKWYSLMFLVLFCSNTVKTLDFS